MRYYIFEWFNKKNPNQKGTLNIEANDVKTGEKIAKIYLSNVFQLGIRDFHVRKLKHLVFISKDLLVETGMANEAIFK